MHAGWGIKRPDAGAHWSDVVWGWLLWTGWIVVGGFCLLFIVAIASGFVPTDGLRHAFAWMLHGPAGIVPGQVGVTDLCALSLALAVLGLWFGLIERGVLQFHGKRAPRLVPAAMIGSALGPWATYALGTTFDAINNPVSWVLLGPMSVTLMAIAQWLAVRSEIEHGRWMVAAVAIAWLSPTRSVVGVYTIALGPALGFAAAILIVRPSAIFSAPSRTPRAVTLVAPMLVTLAAIGIGIDGPRAMAANIQLVKDGASPVPQLETTGASVTVGSASYSLRGQNIEVASPSASSPRSFPLQDDSQGSQKRLDKIVAIGNTGYIFGSIAFAGGGNAGSAVWAQPLVSDGSLPRATRLNAISGPIDIARANDRLITVSQVPYPYYSVELFDVATPTNPKQVGFFELGERTTALAARDAEMRLEQNSQVITLRISGVHDSATP